RPALHGLAAFAGIAFCRLPDRIPRMKTPSTTTRFARHFGLDTPIALAPMALATGGALASACARAGALGLAGCGHGQLEWTQAEYTAALQDAPRERIGCGFITWQLAEAASGVGW